MRTTEKQPLPLETAVEMWEIYKQRVGVAIIHTIRTMGLPTPHRRDANAPKFERATRAPTSREVRMFLLEDRDFQTEIVEQIEMEFWRCYARGGITYREGCGLLALIAERVTWKKVTRRARELFRTVTPVDGTDILSTLVADGPLPDDLAGDKELLTRLQEVLGRLSETDRQLLLAKVEGYDGLDIPGVSRVGVRSRVHRLWQKVVAEVREPRKTA